MNPGARRTLGRTDVEVTALGFGAAPIGGFRATMPDRDAIGIVDAAWDAGVRYYDTSPFYGYGRSELRIGAALRDRPRGDFTLSTKVGRVMRVLRPGEAEPAGLRKGGLPGFVPEFDYSYDGILRSIEQSWLRLGLARIDIALIHDVDFWTLQDHDRLDRHFRQVMEGGYRALHELRAAGVIGAIGCGLNDSAMCARFLRAGDFDCMLLAGRYTLLEQGALEDLLPDCERRACSIILGGPFNSGLLAGPVRDGAWYDYAPAPPAILDRARRLEAVCARHGVKLPAAALQFPLAHPAVVSVIPGALAAHEVVQNAAHLQRAIPPALWAELRHEKLLHPAAPVPA
jgi:D-threo-aldose 1-dehydrogenase